LVGLFGYLVGWLLLVQLPHRLAARLRYPDWLVVTVGLVGSVPVGFFSSVGFLRLLLKAVVVNIANDQV